MPELPEVRTVALYLNSKLSNKKILNATNFTPKLIWRNSEVWFLNTVANKKIKKVFNYGKYLIFDLFEYQMISHLRMEGKWTVSEYSIYVYPQKHLRIEFNLSNSQVLRYFDSRKFGTLELWKTDNYITESGMNLLGPEPLNNNPSYEYLANKAKKTKVKVKPFLLDQSVLCGIGNIYANEILFAANIAPDRISDSLTKKEIENIIKCSNKILQRSIDLKGTSIHSYKSGDGIEGKFQNELKVHSKEGQPCEICHALIAKTKVAGRGTYFCINCQK